MITFSVGPTRCTMTFGFAAVVCATFMFSDAAVAAAVLLCIAWHEMGHLVALALLHTPPEQVCMTAIGLEISGGGLGGYREEAWVSLAGPLANLLAAILLWFTPFRMAARLHMLLGLFHLLPVLPLDGGQALQSLLCLWLPFSTAGRIMTIISAAILLPLGTLGFFLLFQTQPNITLFALCLYLLFYLVFKNKQ